MQEYEVRNVDAWAGMEPGMWEYNETWHEFDFRTNAKDEKKAFRRALNRHGITLTNRCRVEDHFECMEVVVRKTGMPIFCALWKN